MSRYDSLRAVPLLKERLMVYDIGILKWLTNQ